MAAAAALRYNAAIVIPNEYDNTRGASAARRTVVVGRVQRSLVGGGGGWNSSSPDDPELGYGEDGWWNARATAVQGHRHDKWPTKTGKITWNHDVFRQLRLRVASLRRLRFIIINAESRITASSV